MPITKEAIITSLKIHNPFFDVTFPENGEIHAIIDTGYTGFLLVPKIIFNEAKLNMMKSIKMPAETANGRKVDLYGAYGTIILTEFNIELDGLIETSEEITEILLGYNALETLRLVIDRCNDVFSIEKCMQM